MRGEWRKRAGRLLIAMLAVPVFLAVGSLILAAICVGMAAATLGGVVAGAYCYVMGGLEGIGAVEIQAPSAEPGPSCTIVPFSR